MNDGTASFSFGSHVQTSRDGRAAEDSVAVGEDDCLAGGDAGEGGGENDPNT